MRPTRLSSVLLVETVWTCFGGGARFSQRWETSPLRVHCTLPGRFVSAAVPTLSDSRSEPGHLHREEGTFLSV